MTLTDFKRKKNYFCSLQSAHLMKKHKETAIAGHMQLMSNTS